MDSTINYAVIAIVATVVLVVFLFIAKRVLRLAVRLMLVGVFIFALLAAGAWGWWNGWFGWQTTPRMERSAPARRTPAR